MEAHEARPSRRVPDEFGSPLNSRQSPAGYFASFIYNGPGDPHNGFAFGETIMPQDSQLADKQLKPMGDKSPKANQKKNSQKQAIANSADQKKKSAIAAQQSAGKRK